MLQLPNVNDDPGVEAWTFFAAADDERENKGWNFAKVKKDVLETAIFEHRKMCWKPLYSNICLRQRRMLGTYCSNSMRPSPPPMQSHHLPGCCQLGWGVPRTQ
eukprot:6026422-Pleurochrysis_carterae.AAC.1